MIDDRETHRLTLELAATRLQKMLAHKSWARLPPLIQREGRRRLWDAQSALLADDLDNLRHHAIMVPAFVRDFEATLAAAGGKTSGGNKTRQADAFWAPWRLQFRELVEAGRSEPDARAVIGSRIRKAVGGKTFNVRQLLRQLPSIKSDMS